MSVYKIYVLSKKKDGIITRSDYVIVKEANKEDAVKAAIKYAKNYGFKGKVHIGTTLKRMDNKQYEKC